MSSSTILTVLIQSSVQILLLLLSGLGISTWVIVEALPSRQLPLIYITNNKMEVIQCIVLLDVTL